MPTVLRFEGLPAVTYPNDHRPAHVHVIGKGKEAVFNLNCPSGRVGVRENYVFSRREIRHIVPVLSDQRSALCDAWKTIHGDLE